MQPTRVAVGPEAVDLQNQPVHEWRVTRLTGLGTPGRWPRSTRTTWTGIRSPGWCGAAAPPMLAPRIIR